jgi:MFS family permease
MPVGMRLPSPYGRMLAPVYVPTLLIATSLQGLSILLPLHVLGLGGSAPFAASVVGLRGVGLLLFDVPAGLLAARVGDKPVLLGGVALILLGLLTLGFTASPWVIGAAAVVLGAGEAAWILGRQSYIGATCAPGEVGRAIAVMGGLQRAGAFVGPAAGGLLAAALGYHAAFLCGAAAASLAVLFVLAFTRMHKAGQSLGESVVGMADVLRAHRRVFATAGVAALALQLMRAARQLLVPLCGEAAGLDVAAIGLVYSASSAVDMSLFYPVGVLVDRWGRKFSAVPSMALFVAGLSLLPWARSLPGLLAVGILLGLANGIGTGIVMIMGADIAGPGPDRGRVLGVWRLIGDVGMMAAPLLTSVLVDASGLALASLSVAAIGLAGTLVMLFLVGETLTPKKGSELFSPFSKARCVRSPRLEKR